MQKAAQFGWRASRNLICSLPGGAALLFPPEVLANRFGRGDADYSLRVYRHHAGQLQREGFPGAASILEIGPGRNLGTALLWWCRALGEGRDEACVDLWDVHANAHPAEDGYWANLAEKLIVQLPEDDDSFRSGSPARAILGDVAAGCCRPGIAYHVCPMKQLPAVLGQRRFELVLSHAALEHVWEIGKFWPLITHLSVPLGWHSHRIDLADHGRRDGNYLEMLEWSRVAWWLTMRFIPGAINRWRVGEYETAIRQANIHILGLRREQRTAVPVPRKRLARTYRDLADDELTTTAIDIVGRCEGGCAS